jgi:hypothetical protein
MQTKPGASYAKSLFLPQNNHWLKRISLVYAFIIFDYLSTLAFCHSPYQEANIYARAFMQNLGIPTGLSIFVIIINLPIYMMLSIDSHVVRLPSNLTKVAEIIIDCLFAWFVAGLHFSGGTSWFWSYSDMARQLMGTILYLTAARVFIRTSKATSG